MQPLNEHIPHYDLSFLKELDDDQCIREVISMFLENTPLLLAEIGRAIESEDRESIYQKAHKLKSSVGLLKMSILLQYIEDIERNARGGTDLASIREWFKAALSEYGIASAQMEKEVE